MTPPDVDPELWARYIRGSRAVDDLYSKGQRCPKNPAGARCLCGLYPKKDCCVFFNAVVALAREIGGATWTVVEKIT